MSDIHQELRDYIGQRKLVSPFHLQVRFDEFKSSGMFEDSYIEIPAYDTPHYTGFSEEFRQLWMRGDLQDEANLAVVIDRVGDRKFILFALHDQLKAMVGEPDEVDVVAPDRDVHYPVYFGENIREEIPEWNRRMDDLINDDIERPKDEFQGNVRRFRNYAHYKQQHKSIL